METTQVTPIPDRFGANLFTSDPELGGKIGSHALRRESGAEFVQGPGMAVRPVHHGEEGCLRAGGSGHGPGDSGCGIIMQIICVICRVRESSVQESAIVSRFELKR